MSQRGIQLDGRRVIALYKSKGWSQQDLARRAGLDARTINKVCRGGKCDSSTHSLLAQALGVDPESLLPAAATGDATLPGSAEDPVRHGKDLVVEQVWKIIDLRTPLTDKDSPGVATSSAWVWDHYRIRKQTDARGEIVFPYLTWGDRIECEEQPPGAAWRKVQVQPGDLVHSEKQWELAFPIPGGPADTVFEVRPIKLRFVGAFAQPDQQWWQIRVPFVIESVIIQVLFPADRPCLGVHGSHATFAERRFVDATYAPYLLADGTLASWHIAAPELGNFYRIAWEQAGP